MRVLITGAAGSVGRVLVAGLQDRYVLRGFDRVEPPAPTDCVIGDLTDMVALRRATAGMDAIIHLTAVIHGRDEWEQVLANNIIGWHNVLEAARESGAVPRWSRGLRENRRMAGSLAISHAPVLLNGTVTILRIRTTF